MFGGEEVISLLVLGDGSLHSSGERNKAVFKLRQNGRHKLTLSHERQPTACTFAVALR